ncbi:purine-binding chemotaxis protein CheW [Bosea sp. BE125]|uniref:chemotaxis protein CheW n=1 Tax=Bosea sp. BE125 TaxID=2817909 RepID=UPI00285C2227|nr:chemotaxis protein CheW [Bosea sp. BE125]MDR6874011.1 purine-binding chemotaxis protein CheW [Bosea sp. BE125]
MQQVQERKAAAAASAEAETRLQVLMVGLGNEIFAIETDMVREIIDPVPVTRVAGARAFLPALINVRGNVIPLADLRLRFGMPAAAATADTRIVVIEIEIDGDPVTLGIIADKVYEVTEVSSRNTQQTPRMGLHWKPEFIRLITKWNDEFVIVPEIARIMN